MKHKGITGLIIGGLAVASVPQVALASWELDQWGNELLNVESYHQAGITGKGVKVAILDTGIADHRELNVIERVNFVDGETEEDLNGHGTAVAGIIGAKDDNYGVVGIAPDVELYSVKVLDENGQTPNLSNVAEGVRWAIENDIDIINISIGGTATPSQDVLNAFAEAEQAGILVVAGTGNHEDVENLKGKVSYPAKISSVVGVGAVNESLSHWEESATGEGINLVAPGVNIKTTYLDNNYFNATGTSFATPHVTGTLALLKQAYPDKSPSELREMLYTHAQDLGQEGYDTTYGYGLLQLPSVPKESEPIDEETPVEPKHYDIHYDSTRNEVTWDSIDEADRYRVEVYQKNTDGEFESYRYPQSVLNTFYSLEQLEGGYEYQIVVTPRIDYVFDETQSLEINVLLKKETVDEPIQEEQDVVQNVTVNVEGTTASIEWEQFNDVSRYRVQAYVKEDGTFEKDSYARSATGTSYTFNNLDEGKEYKFAIIPRTNFYDASKQGVSESVAVSPAEPEKPVEEVSNTIENITVSLDGTTASIEWNEMNGVSRYRVQAYIKNDNGEFVKDSYARTTSNTSYSFKYLDEGKEYKFVIIPRTNFYDSSKQGISESIIVPIQK